jgi:uncharacterized protein (TIGR03084 family)
MTTLQEVVGDLRDEVAALDALLSTLDDDAWFTPTPAEGWDIRDTVAHLADTDDLMYEETTGDFSPKRSSFQGATLDDFTAWQVDQGRALAPRDVFDWWRSATARLHSRLEACDPKGRYSWRGNMISPLSLASARLMETWAHSLDCHAAMGNEFAPTERLRHIAQLGARALPHAFAGVGLGPPAPLRLDLTSPAGDAWAFGADDAPNVIRGSMWDWCEIVGRRDRDGAAARLNVQGPDVANILEHASAF